MRINIHEEVNQPPAHLTAELHERRGRLAVDSRSVSLPIKDSAPVTIAGGSLAADKRHDGITRHGLKIEHLGSVGGCLFHFQNVNQVYHRLALEEFGRGSGVVDALLETGNSGVLVRRGNEQIEFAVAPQGFILGLLVGGKQKFADVDHLAAFLVRVQPMPEAILAGRPPIVQPPRKGELPHIKCYLKLN